VKSLPQHPIKKMLDAGLCVTINSDDPAYFGGYINDNYIESYLALDFNKDEILQIVKNSFDSSFLFNPNDFPDIPNLIRR
jgi:adenosine deaminase